jgi:triosephosphate isomerase
MSRTPFVAGNWKMNLDRAASIELAKLLAAEEHPGVDEGCCPPFVYLDAVKQHLGSKVMLGAQDVYFEGKGAFTGEVSAEMLVDVGCSFCLVGHSERRHVLHEPTDLLAKKAATVVHAGMTLVHCVGETLEQRESDQTFGVIDGQLSELSPKFDDPAKVVIAYEPVWAIGTGKVASPEQAQEVHAYVREQVKEDFGGDFADAVRIIYGGSVKGDNAAELLGQPDVDGALVGGASLKADAFLPILRAAREQA